VKIKNRNKYIGLKRKLRATTEVLGETTRLVFPLKANRQQIIDLSFLNAGSYPRRQMAEVFVWYFIHSPIVSTATRDGRLYAIRKFNKFLNWKAEGGSQISSTLSITAALLLEYQLWLTAVAHISERSAHSSYIALTSVFRYLQKNRPDFLENGWFVIIHDTMAPISLPAVAEALNPSAPFGAPIHINAEPGPLPWSEPAEYQRRAVLDAVEKSRDILPRFAVFSLSQIALCIHLGFVLSDRLEVRCFQFDRDARTWRWPEVEDDADTTISVGGLPADSLNDGCEAVVRISLSAPISIDAVREAVGCHPVEIELSAPSPDVMWLRSPKQLSVLGKTFRTVLAKLRTLVPNCTRIHLFYAGPTGGAITIGQQINPRMNPPIELYEYSRQTKPNHRWALTLEDPDPGGQ
jgi:hypothetical protein